MFRKIAAITLHLCLCISGISQPAAVYSFPLEDTTLKNQLYHAVLDKKNALLAALDKEHREEYRDVYEDRFELIAALMKSSRLVAEPDAHQYLQQVLDRIVSVNGELKPLSIRLVFSRDWWPNASSVGEGTLIVNAGLLVRLKNESELTFVLCHELAHLYLDHAGKSIRKNISTLNSDAFRSELKKLAKQEYGAGAGLEKLFRMLAFGFRRHSRENEAEADEMGIQFMRNTGFSGQGAISCLQTLDKVDDSSYYAGLDLPAIFNFPDYYFRKRWIQNESMIFGQMKEDGSALTEAEKDSLRTHPDCPKRIAALEPLVLSFPAGRDFLVDAAMFNRLKDRFSVEIIEELYQEEQYALNLYYALGLLQSGRHRDYAVYSVARVLNGLYEAQLNHRFGLVTVKENRVNSANYNLLLRMLDRVRLDELAALAYYFCSQFRQEMAGYTAFETEWKKAQENKEKSSH
ncbi:MAG: M48 family metalloprotease [Sphingobacteriales bacterium]|nr:M48 family metalloprotease [Sphingobacteriales bacterium]